MLRLFHQKFRVLTLPVWVSPPTYIPSLVTHAIGTPETSSDSIFPISESTKFRSCVCLWAGSLPFDFSRLQIIKLGTGLTSLNVVFTAFNHNVISYVLTAGSLLLVLVVTELCEWGKWFTTMFDEAKRFPSTQWLNIVLFQDFSGAICNEKCESTKDFYLSFYSMLQHHSFPTSRSVEAETTLDDNGFD